jgi:hypothetical protein
MTLPAFRLIRTSLVLAASTSAPAFAAGKDDAGGTFGLYFENDLFSGTDQHYTNGFKLG